VPVRLVPPRRDPRYLGIRSVPCSMRCTGRPRPIPGDLVVSSEQSRPNRRCRKNASASPTTARFSSSTVQYRAPDGSLTRKARTPSPDPVPGNPLTTTSDTHHSHGETLHDQQRALSTQHHTTPRRPSESIELAYTRPSIVAGSSRAVIPLPPCARTTA
jgi:hypothetical protein